MMGGRKYTLPTGSPRTIPSRMTTSTTAKIDSSVSSSSFLDFFLKRVARRFGRSRTAADVQSMLAVNSSRPGNDLV